MNKDKLFWNNKKVLITGHTGFKGSWLSLLLSEFGANLYGYSLKPEKNFLYDKAKLNKIFKKSIFGDILNFKKINKFIKNIKPEVIFHLAAEPLVFESYKNPKKTFNVNLIGTLNLLESIRENHKYVKSVIIVTTDKVYKTLNNNPFYNEGHSLGASDPYGTSKVCVELLSETYFKSFFQNLSISIFTVRAGNVIGGGDFSKNRIVPDYLKSRNQNKVLIIRNPNHIRPWQYVLDPLYGYTLLVRKYYVKQKQFSAWNFAPPKKNFVQVSKLINYFKELELKNRQVKIKFKSNKSFKETKVLRLDSQKSKKILKWKSNYNLKKTISSILNWNEDINNDSCFDTSVKSIKNFLIEKNNNSIK